MSLIRFFAGFTLLLLLGLLHGCASNKESEAQPAVVEHGLTKPLEAPPFHMVVAGDTVYSIALRYDRDYRELAQINHLPDNYRIRVGQKLWLDADAAPKVVAKPKPHPVPKPVVEKPIVEKPLAEKPAAPKVAAAPVEKTDAERLASLAGEKPVQLRPVTIDIKPPEGSVSFSPVTLAPVQTTGSSNVLIQQGSSGLGSAENAARKSPPVGNPSRTVAEPAARDADFSWGWPAKGPILSRFSESGISNKGVDIGGKRGDPVFSAGDGSVVYVGSGLVGYGKLIIIRHNNNYLSAYAHNDRFLVKEGQRVKLGQEIAEMGSSGADREKLHFEIRRQGKPVDPLQYLPAR